MERVKLSTPADVIAAVPLLLGFHPEDSMAVLGCSGDPIRAKLTFRYDLADGDDADLIADMAEHAITVLTERECAKAVLVGYGPGSRVTPVMDAMRSALADVVVLEALRVEDGRWWSYLCTDKACCAPDGTPINPDGTATSTGLAVAGYAAQPSRQALEASLAAPTGADAKAARRALDRALRRVDTQMTEADVVVFGKQHVLDALDAARGAECWSLDEVTFLAVMLRNLHVRDDAWARLDPAHSREHMTFLADVAHRVHGSIVAPAASLLAFTAWQNGEGAIANIAVERALAAEPDYTMATLIRHAVQAGLPPSAARPPVTPEQVAASYK